MADPEAGRANGDSGHKPVKTPGTLDEWRLPGKEDTAQQASERAAVGYQPGSSKRIQEGASDTVEAFENAAVWRSRPAMPRLSSSLRRLGIAVRRALQAEQG